MRLRLIKNAPATTTSNASIGSADFPTVQPPPPDPVSSASFGSTTESGSVVSISGIPATSGAFHIGAEVIRKRYGLRPPALRARNEMNCDSGRNVSVPIVYTRAILLTV